METDTVTALPSAPLAEKAVLCQIVNDARALSRVKAENICAECFHTHSHRVFWIAAGDYLAANTEAEIIDLVAFTEFLRDRGELEATGGHAAFADIMGYATHAHCNLPFYLRTLREMRARRMAMSAAGTIYGARDSEEAISAAKGAVDALQRAVAAAGRAIGGKQAASEFVTRFLADHGAGEIPGRPTGIPGVDEGSGGMRPGELWIVGGQTSGGKSVLMIQTAAEFLERGEPVAIFSLEMMANEVIARLVSVLGWVKMSAVTQPRTATSLEIAKIKAAAERIQGLPLWIDASANQSSDSILAEAERIRDAQGSLALVVVDYLQLIRGGRNRGESREEEVARASGALKQLAKHLNCPVMSATQLNEANKTRESRAIGHDADAFLLIEDDGIRVAKMRNGPRGQLLSLTLNGAMQRFQPTT